MVQQQVVSSSSSSSSSAHIFIKSRLKNPLQNFAEGEAGESRDNVAEAHPRENFRGAGGRSPRQCGRSRRPGKRLEYAKRLEQVERLKAKERMVTSTGGANRISLMVTVTRSDGYQYGRS